MTWPYTTIITKLFPCLIYYSHDKCMTHHILVFGKNLAWRHKFTYQVIRSLVSMRHFIFKKTWRDGDVNYCRCGNDCIGLIIITGVIFSIVNVHLSIVENNLFLYCSHLNMHINVYLYTSGRHINFLLFKLHVSYCENLIFFSSSNMSRKLRKKKRKKKGKNGVNYISNWSDSWRKCIATWNSSCILLILFPIVLDG